jgi:hypothetical protein
MFRFFQVYLKGIQRAAGPQEKNQNISRKGAKAAKFGQVRRYFFLCVLGVLAREIS